MCRLHPPVLVLISWVLNNCHPVSSRPVSRQPSEHTWPCPWRAGWLKPLPGTPHTARRHWEGNWTGARGQCSSLGSAGFVGLDKSLRHFEACCPHLHNRAAILSAPKGPRELRWADTMDLTARITNTCPALGFLCARHILSIGLALWWGVGGEKSPLNSLGLYSRGEN